MYEFVSFSGFKFELVFVLSAIVSAIINFVAYINAIHQQQGLSNCSVLV